MPEAAKDARIKKVSLLIHSAKIKICESAAKNNTNTLHVYKAATDSQIVKINIYPFI